ncbi:hypothetical protein [Amycolatopsis sp. WAC 04197]|uniref:hypothetical protein n=1 Tax=Amycolatopsis sp. WAC 04197 TaxID=2203199 RepID=UPI001315AA60|nr:hypothetical protein [Amycolatopsis sp. WAC 04197]
MLDTACVSEGGEYAAHMLTVNDGGLGDPVGSFGELVVLGREELEELRETDR